MGLLGFQGGYTDLPYVDSYLPVEPIESKDVPNKGHWNPKLRDRPRGLDQVWGHGAGGGQEGLEEGLLGGRDRRHVFRLTRLSGPMLGL